MEMVMPRKVWDDFVVLDCVGSSYLFATSQLHVRGPSSCHPPAGFTVLRSSLVLGVPRCIQMLLCSFRGQPSGDPKYSKCCRTCGQRNAHLASASQPSTVAVGPYTYFEAEYSFWATICPWCDIHKRGLASTVNTCIRAKDKASSPLG